LTQLEIANLIGREPFAGVFGGIYKEPEARKAGQDRSNAFKDEDLQVLALPS
jgi:hypothetical protein